MEAVVLKEKKSKVDHTRLIKFFHNLEYERSVNSCGVTEVEDVAMRFDMAFNSGKDLNAATKKHMIKNFLDLLHEGAYLSDSYEYDNYTKAKRICCFFNISLVKSKANPVLLEILDKVCITKSTWRKNPNSGNMIKVWLI